MDPERIVTELATIDGRGACTDAERRAARVLAGELRGLDRRPRVDTVWVRPQWPWWWLVLSLAGVAASVVSTGDAAVGLGIAAAAALAALVELDGRVAAL